MREKLDHTKKYTVIDGHIIEMSFSESPNNDLFSRISDILLNADTHVCQTRTLEVEYQAETKEV